MFEGYQPLQGKPVSRVLVIELTIIFAGMMMALYVFGFSYGFKDTGAALSFPGVVNHK